MNHFSFNVELISCLPNVLDLSVAEIARRCDFKQPTLRMYINRDRDIPVQTLMSLCNTFRIPTHYFFYDCGTYIIPPRELATVEEALWRPVTWDTQPVELLFGDSPGHIFWKDVANTMGVTDQKPRARFALKTRFPVTDFLRVCNTYDISPYTFIKDPNFIPTQHKRNRRGIVVPPAPATPDANRQIFADIAELQRQISFLTETVADLTAKYTAILQTCDALAKRVNVNIENFKDSHLSIAAEPLKTYKKKKE